MNRRDLLKAIAAIPVVAALAPLLPKSGAFKEADLAALYRELPMWDVPPLPRPPRYLRYKITWPGIVVFNERTMARLTGVINETVDPVNVSAYSEPAPVSQAPWRSDDDHVTVYPMVEWNKEPETYRIDVESSEDGEQWEPADPKRVKVRPLL